MAESTKLKIDWCDHAAALYAVRKWHYSKSLPPPPLVKFGVWEDDSFRGVVISARGANRNLLSQFGLQQTEGAELVRVALRTHKTEVSRIMSICVRILKKTFPSLKVLVSFADPEQGHIGAIYQAGNWLYLGKSGKSKVYIDAKGKRWHPRMISSSGKKRVFGQMRKVLRPSDCKVVEQEGKHRYAFPLDDEMKLMLAAIKKSYPTRGAASVEAARLPFQAESSGAVPTAALHFNGTIKEDGEEKG